MAVPRLSLLSDDDCAYLREQALTILAEVGARCENAKARALLEEAGCPVNHDTMRVKLPRDVVPRAIDLLQGEVLLASSEGRAAEAGRPSLPAHPRSP